MVRVYGTRLGLDCDSVPEGGMGQFMISMGASLDLHDSQSLHTSPAGSTHEISASHTRLHPGVLGRWRTMQHASFVRLHENNKTGNTSHRDLQKPIYFPFTGPIKQP